MAIVMAVENSSSSGGLGASLHALNVFIFEKNKKITSIVGAIAIVALTFAVFSWEASAKSGEMLDANDIKRILLGYRDDRPDFGGTEGFIEMREVFNADGSLMEGSRQDFTIEANSQRVIERIDITLTWSDEETPPGIRLRRYENEPDTFKLNLVEPDNNLTSFGETDIGTLEGRMSYDNDRMAELYGMGNFTIQVILQNAGNWVPGVSIGFLEMPDTGNDFSINVEIVYLGPQQEEE
ncbi:MAG: hypothetical protein ACMUHB_03130 [Thermoplasmatota archaeon]